MVKDFGELSLKSRKLLSKETTESSILRNDSHYVMKHAVVRAVKALSSKYLIAELEVIEGLKPKPRPTQYVMVWVPRIDYFPMSIAWFSNNFIQIFFSVRGQGTEALSKSVDSIVGLVGPLGNWLAPQECGSECLIVAGGTGLASVITLAKELKELGKQVEVVWGVRSGNEVGDVPKYLKKVTGVDPIICTEDCTQGYCGRALDIARELIRGGTYTTVVSSGPNQMSYAIGELSLEEGIKAYLVLESVFECGIGLCGSCPLKDLGGLRLCVDGPAVRASRVIKYLRRIKEYVNSP